MPPRFAITRHVLLLGSVFAGIGVVQPFLPAFLAARGLSPGEVSLVLAAGSGIRLLAGPLAGRGADALGDPRLLLALAALAGALASGGYLLAGTVLGFLLTQLAFHAASAPLTPLTDTLCLAAARRDWLDYGRVRAAGSLAFMAAAMAAGWLAGRLGLGVVPLLMGGAMLATLAAALLLPRAGADGRSLARRREGGFRATLRLPGFIRLLLLSGLIQSSHAAYYAFGSIHWSAAGLSATGIGLLWALGVVGEVLLFLLGRRLVARLGARGLALLAAGAGVLRWSTLAGTAWLPALVATQLLHALTFGAQHLAAMQLILALVPPAQAGTAQTLHAALGVGLMSGSMTLLCGPLYAAWGAGVFLVMAGLCLLALPLALGLPRGGAGASAAPS
ncbi:MFS transporter [Pseudoroseomonas sp. WGS1072]|uniref:MFS transporter n=1 Tax=Roseomonas sp. WGS1072 TaxID=3366816 RepID=UPI003BF118C8